MIWIGIDPGVHTGLAVWDGTAGRFLSVDTLPLHRAIFRVGEIAAAGVCSVVFEDARLRRWIPREKDLAEYRGRLMGAGSVKRDCTVWEEFLTDAGIPYRAVAPRKGATKWSEGAFRNATGWTGRTSNHARDAALLVYGMR